MVKQKKPDRIDAYDLIIALCALNPMYKTGFNRVEFYKNLINHYPHDTLKQALIVPHPIHQDSTYLNNALDSLVANRVFKLWTPGMMMQWDFPCTPAEYYIKKIKPKLKLKQLEGIEELARSL